MRAGCPQEARLCAKRCLVRDHQRQRLPLLSASATSTRLTPLPSLARPERVPCRRLKLDSETLGPCRSTGGAGGFGVVGRRRSVNVQWTVSPGARFTRVLCPPPPQEIDTRS